MATSTFTKTVLTVDERLCRVEDVLAGMCDIVAQYSKGTVAVSKLEAFSHAIWDERFGRLFPDANT